MSRSSLSHDADQVCGSNVTRRYPLGHTCHTGQDVVPPKSLSDLKVFLILVFVMEPDQVLHQIF